jgi:hypothetical protein
MEARSTLLRRLGKRTAAPACLASAVAACTHSWALASSTLHVPGEFPTIADAIMVAMDGDVIQLAPGAYLEPFSFGFKAVTIRGTPEAPGQTVVSPEAVNGELLLTIPATPEGDTIMLDGLTLGGFAEFSVMDGSLHVRNSVITADTGGFSMAFGVTNGTLLVTNVTIVDSGYEPHDTPIFHVHAGISTLSNLFVTAGSRPIFRAFGSESIITGSSFSGLTLDSIAERRGAVEAIGGELAINSTTFSSIAPGSAIVGEASGLQLTNVHFDAVADALKGGDCAVAAVGPWIELTECTATRCGSFGSNASVADLTSPDLLIDGCDFSGNRISDVGSGALRLNGVATIRDTTFEANSTFGQGGAIVLFGSASIEDSIFAKNTGGDGSGAIRLLGSATLTGCTFRGNVAGDGNYDAPLAGGAICVDGGSATLNDCLLSDNIAAANGKFLGIGGGIAAIDGATLVLNGTSILHNVALTAGGGVYVDASSSLMMTDATVCSNLPDQVQGIYVSAGSSVVCGCAGDITGDGSVDANDLALVLGSWGPCSGVAADLSQDGVIDASDLAIVLGGWGACP